jgi:hypothetical protein
MSLTHTSMTKQLRISHVAQVIEPVIQRLMMKICHGSVSWLHHTERGRYANPSVS